MDEFICKHSDNLLFFTDGNFSVEVIKIEKNKKANKSGKENTFRTIHCSLERKC